MVRSKPEQIVVDACKKRLDYWMNLEKVVIDYYDLSKLGVKFIRGQWITHNVDGRPDLVVYVRAKTILWLYMIEAKRPDGGVWGGKQKEYAKRFEGVGNCLYQVVTKPTDVDIAIERISRHSQTKLEGIEGPNE